MSRTSALKNLVERDLFELCGGGGSEIIFVGELGVFLLVGDVDFDLLPFGEF